MLSEAIRRECGQHFVLGFHGHQVSDDIKTLIQTYFVGSVILMKRNVQDRDQTRKLILELQTLAKDAGHAQPLLIGTDQENGLVSALTSATTVSQFPGAMNLAATGSEELVSETYKASGLQLRLLGVNWAYSPVADVNSDMRNPVIGVRSFGDDPVQVGKYVMASAKGLITSKVAPSLKHFPGHGDTHVDSHLALPRIMKTKEEISQNELVPFRMFVDEGLQPTDSTIMIGHMALPLITGSDEPSSLSGKIVTGILRREMGYEGVIVTDCLEMDAIAQPACGGCGVEEGSVRALEAGSDVIMICHTMDWQVGALKKTYEAVEGGRLELGSLQASGKRIADLKTRYLGSWEDTLEELAMKESELSSRWNEAKEHSAPIIEEAYSKSVALLQSGAPGVIPLKPSAEMTTLLYTPEQESLNKAVDDADGVLRGKNGAVRNTAGAAFVALSNAVSQRTRSEHIVYRKVGGDELPADWTAISNIIFVLRNANTASWQLERLQAVLAQANLHRVPLVVVASCTPYDLLGVSGLEGQPYLATFEFTPPAFEAAVRIIFGEAAAYGVTPVRLS